MQNLCETRRRFVARNAVLTALLLSSALPMAVHADPVIFNSPVVANDPKLDQALLAQLHKKQWDAARQSLKVGARANAQDKDGTTALMLAVQEGQVELVDALLKGGADVNAANKAGQTALHLATQIGAPKPKKKSPFGGIVKSLGGMIMGGALGAFGGFSMLGSRGVEGMLGSNLQGLLGGGAFNLGGRSGWTAVLGTALQGDLQKQGAYGLQNVLSSQSGALDANGWVSLMRAVQSSNPAVLAAMARPDGGDVEKSALWSQFLSAASSGDQTTVATLLSDERLTPMLAQATQGLRSASGELPANAAHTIVSQLLQSGANAKTADGTGRTAAQLAQERGWNAVADLLQDKPAIASEDTSASS